GLRGAPGSGGMTKPKRPHTLADHAYGDEMNHAHDDDTDHDHDHDHDVGPAGAIEDNPLWQADNITLTSVGIDIGSAGTQVIFSRRWAASSSAPRPATTWKLCSPPTARARRSARTTRIRTFSTSTSAAARPSSRSSRMARSRRPPPSISAAGSSSSTMPGAS